MRQSRFYTSSLRKSTSHLSSSSSIPAYGLHLSPCNFQPGPVAFALASPYGDSVADAEAGKTYAVNTFGVGLRLASQGGGKEVIVHEVSLLLNPQLAIC